MRINQVLNQFTWLNWDCNWMELLPFWVRGCLYPQTLPQRLKKREKQLKKQKRRFRMGSNVWMGPKQFSPRGCWSKMSFRLIVTNTCDLVGLQCPHFTSLGSWVFEFPQFPSILNIFWEKIGVLRFWIIWNSPVLPGIDSFEVRKNVHISSFAHVCLLHISIGSISYPKMFSSPQVKHFTVLSP